MDEKLKNNKYIIKSKKVKFEYNTFINREIWIIVIYTLLGLILECAYSFIYSKISNSTKGFVLGSFCFLYGIGAAILIPILNKYKGKRIKIFTLGLVIGVEIEYIFSFIIEAITGGRIWNLIYKFNLNGRTCLAHAIIIGVLSVIAVEFGQNVINFLSEKLKGKARNIIDTILFVGIIVYMLFTIWGFSVYNQRAKDIYNQVRIFEEKTWIQEAANRIFSNNDLVKAYPSARFIDKDGKIIWLSDQFVE